MVLVIEPRTLQTVGKCSTTKLHPYPWGGLFLILGTR